MAVKFHLLHSKTGDLHLPLKGKTLVLTRRLHMLTATISSLRGCEEHLQPVDHRCWDLGRAPGAAERGPGSGLVGRWRRVQLLSGVQLREPAGQDGAGQTALQGRHRATPATWWWGWSTPIFLKITLDVSLRELSNNSSTLLPLYAVSGLRLGDGRGDDVHSEGQAQRHLHGFWRFLHHRQHGVCPAQRQQPALHPLLHCHPGPLQVWH